MSKDNFISFSSFIPHPFNRKENQGNVCKAVLPSSLSSVSGEPWDILIQAIRVSKGRKLKEEEIHNLLKLCWRTADHHLPLSLKDNQQWGQGAPPASVEESSSQLPCCHRGTGAQVDYPCIQMTTCWLQSPFLMVSALCFSLGLEKIWLNTSLCDPHKPHCISCADFCLSGM